MTGTGGSLNGDFRAAAVAPKVAERVSGFCRLRADALKEFLFALAEAVCAQQVRRLFGVFCSLTNPGKIPGSYIAKRVFLLKLAPVAILYFKALQLQNALVRRSLRLQQAKIVLLERKHHLSKRHNLFEPLRPDLRVRNFGQRAQDVVNGELGFHAGEPATANPAFQGER